MTMTMTIQQMEHRAMMRMSTMNNLEFYGYCVLLSAINAALADAADTIYNSRIDGCLLSIGCAP